jgi:hypothetical protein
MEVIERKALYVGGGLVAVMGVLWLLHNRNGSIAVTGTTSPAAPDVLGSLSSSVPAALPGSGTGPINGSAADTSNVQFPLLPGINLNVPNVPNDIIPSATLPGTNITIGPSTTTNAAPNLSFPGSNFTIGSGNSSGGGSGGCGCGCASGDPAQAIMSYAQQLASMLPAMGPNSPYTANLNGAASRASFTS